MYFSERVVNTWNRLPLKTVDFSSLSRFHKSIELVEFELTVEGGPIKTVPLNVH